MKIVALAATVMLVGLAPRASLAQLRSVADERPSPTSAPLPASATSAKAEWEEALASNVTDAETWSAIGQRLYSAGQYRESIAAFEQALVQRNRPSPEDAQCIAEAYARLGNMKQASRWRAAPGRLALPSRRQARTTV
jgi:uncharacterized protein HemY